MYSHIDFQSLEALTRRTGQRRLYRLEDDFAGHALLVGDRINDRQNFFTHTFASPENLFLGRPVQSAASVLEARHYPRLINTFNGKAVLLTIELQQHFIRLNTCQQALKLASSFERGA